MTPQNQLFLRITIDKTYTNHDQNHRVGSTEIEFSPYACSNRLTKLIKSKLKFFEWLMSVSMENF